MLKTEVFRSKCFCYPIELSLVLRRAANACDLFQQCRLMIILPGKRHERSHPYVTWMMDVSRETARKSLLQLSPTTFAQSQKTCSVKGCRRDSRTSERADPSAGKIISLFLPNEQFGLSIRQISQRSRCRSPFSEPFLSIVPYRFVHTDISFALANLVWLCTALCPYQSGKVFSVR